MLIVFIFLREKEKVSSPQLDYHKIKFDLKTADDRQKAILLQALRWRLTKSPAGEQRDKILESFISNDLFSISKPDNEKNDLVQLLRSDDEAVKQYMARMLNAFASLNKGIIEMKLISLNSLNFHTYFPYVFSRS